MHDFFSHKNDWHFLLWNVMLMSLLFELSFYQIVYLFIKVLVKYVFLGSRIWGTPQTWWAAWINPFFRSGTYSTSNNVYCTIIVK
jgi:hypothetical protein